MKVGWLFSSVTVCALVCAFQLPFSPWSNLSASFLLASGFLVQVLFFMFLHRICEDARDKQTLKRLWGIGAVFCISLIPSLFTHFSFYITVHGLFRIIALMSILFGAFLSFRDKDCLRYLKYVVFGGMVVYCLTGIFQMVFPSEMPSYWTGEAQRHVLPFRVSSLMVNPNLWGAFSSIMVVSLFFTVLTMEESSHYWPCALLFGLFFINLIGTFSRGAWLAALGGFLVCGIYVSMRKIPCGGTSIIKRRIIPFMVISLVLLFPLIQSRVSSLSGKSEFGVAQRLLLYGGVLNHIWDNLPLGSGIGSFQAAFPAYRLVSGQYVYEAHSDYLHFAAESGLPGLGGFLFFAGVLLYLCLTADDAQNALPFFAFLATFLIAANFMTLFYYSFVIVPLLVTGALLFHKSGLFFSSAMKRITGDGKEDGVDSSIPARGLIGIFFGIGISFCCISAIADLYLKEFVSLINENPPQYIEAERVLRKATTFGLFRPDIQYYHGLYWLKLAMVLPSGEKRTHALNNAKEAFEYAATLDKRTARYHTSLATVAVTEGDYTQALKYIDSAVKRDRCSVHLAYTKAVILEQLNDRENALIILEKAIELGGDFIFIYPKPYIPALKMAIDLYEKSGKTEESARLIDTYASILAEKTGSQRQ